MPWVAVAAAEAIDEDDLIEVAAGDRTIVIVRLSDGYFATDGICSHQRARLVDGFVIGGMIECPKHQGRFDVRSGACRGAPASVPLRTYALKVVDGTIHVHVD